MNLFERSKHSIQKVASKFSNRLFLFRFFSFILVFDFIAFLTLGNINPLNLINPLRFVINLEKDERPLLRLTFPLAIIEHNGVESMALSSKDKTINFHEQTITIEQRVSQMSLQDIRSATSINHNINYLINELYLGPANLKAQRFIKSKQLFNDVWYYEENLYLNIKQSTWKKYNSFEKRIAQYCINNSILNNIKIIKKIIWL